MFHRPQYRLVTFGLSLALITAVTQLVDPPATVAEETTASPAPQSTVTRTDAVSAMVTVRASGEQVEESVAAYVDGAAVANPDGTWTAEVARSPVRTKDAAGAWHDIDTTLIERDGAWAPTYAASDLRLSNGGDRVFARITEDGKDLAWSWPTVLPVAGGVAAISTWWTGPFDPVITGVSAAGGCIAGALSGW